MKYSLLLPFKIAATYVPYQLVLSLSAFRAMTRVLLGLNNWEKTLHINAHRNLFEYEVSNSAGGVRALNGLIYES